MTATTPILPPPTRELPLTTTVRRTIAAEHTRFWTVRSTWWSLAAGVGLVLLVALAFGMDAPTVAVPVWVPAEIALTVAQVVLLVPVVLAVTSEHTTGAIRSSLQATPRRLVLAATRTGLSVVVVAVTSAIAAGLAAVVAYVLLPEPLVDTVDIARSVGLVTTVVAASAMLAAGLGFLLRSTAATLTSTFALVLVLPLILPNLPIGWLATVGRALPGFAATSLLESFADPTALAPTRAGVTLGVWVVVATVAGGWSLLRRDAV